LPSIIENIPIPSFSTVRKASTNKGRPWFEWGFKEIMVPNLKNGSLLPGMKKAGLKPAFPKKFEII
jgi:hypothetical protein